jgi:hypothetical protein
VACFPQIPSPPLLCSGCYRRRYNLRPHRDTGLRTSSPRSPPLSCYPWATVEARVRCRLLSLLHCMTSARHLPLRCPALIARRQAPAVFNAAAAYRVRHLGLNHCIAPHRLSAPMPLGARLSPRGRYCRKMLPRCSDNYAKTRPTSSCPIRVYCTPQLAAASHHPAPL